MTRYTGGIRHDYKDTGAGTPDRRRRRVALFIVGLVLPPMGAVLLLLGTPREPVPVARGGAEVQASADAPPIILPSSALESPLQGVDPTLVTPPATPLIDPASTMLNLLVRPGDTLELLFRRNGLSLSDLAAIVSLPDATRALKVLKPGDRLEIAHRDGQVVSLQREIDEVKVLSIARADSGFAARTLERQVDVRTTGAHGVIQSSLFEAGTAAGIADRLVMDMAGIFEWDIDFIQDVREGDQFSVIYEELWRDGVKLRDGDVVAAEFVNQGKAYRAVRFRDSDGRADYFTPDGRSLRKAFIRAPLNFTRISSNFNPNRRHPLLNTIRAHQGVDYAAPTGTPVRAAGNGKVLFRGGQGGYGNVLILQHGGNITTLYGHLSRFANARVGARVQQGDIIAYVGMTGLATGPHLHYEYRVNGVHRNPRTVALPPAEPVAPEHQAEFRLAAEPLWRELDAFSQGASTTAAN
ncbi:MAG: peptidoglycan DD-metalloendopeptidase family protein [Gammaproteobacteria bacterium]